MDKNRKISITVGILILVAYAVLANTIIESKIIVMISEVISGIAVIGIAVLMFKFFESYNKILTISYLLLKAVEGALMIIAGILFLSLDILLLEIRNSLYVIHTYVFIVSAFIFYLLLYRSKIIPQFISIWGFIALIFLIIVNFLGTVNNPILNIFYLPIILNEIFLAVWLIVKGFNLKEIKK